MILTMQHFYPVYGDQQEDSIAGHVEISAITSVLDAAQKNAGYRDEATAADKMGGLIHSFAAVPGA